MPSHYSVGVGVSPSRISHITIEWRILNILAENVALGGVSYTRDRALSFRERL
jgi:hypothetical protein